MTIHNYLAENFPENELDGGLYFDWPAGLHFELASGIYQFNDDDTYNEERFAVAIRQATQILDEAIAEEDELLLVLDVFWDTTYERTRLFKNYVTDKSLKFKATLTRFNAETEGEFGGTRISLPCRKADLKVHKLIAAVCHEDFPPRTPRFLRHNKVRSPDLYFVNQTKNLVIFMYDDRGMEVVAKDFEMLRPMGEKYKSILQYSRPIALT